MKCGGLRAGRGEPDFFGLRRILDSAAIKELTNKSVIARLHSPLAFDARRSARIPAWSSRT
jgi:hypothetical protein